MYKISVPLMNSNLKRNNREKALELLSENLELSIF